MSPFYPALQVDVTGWLIDQLDAALSATVDSDTPDDLQAVVPFVRVVRAGGPDDNHVLDIPTVVFHCFALTEQEANQLGYATAAAVRALRGAPAGGAVVTQTRMLSGPAWDGYVNTNVRQSVLTMQIRIKTTF